ncbi:uncharacterized protein LOC120797086 [Xiphias gladius]|uniref:uncharacterized protein LOC120797086 n=1 Tax=Xiphias gladius TaxID=8245 RepID=UPI001A988E2D|nr:uncharacterized protein LOC120797086 [Xiphias gladius]XP_039996304.1 uncharacterized protein LOC120797086 [Xiphias gladius]
MRNFTSITALFLFLFLLFVSGWISVSVSQSQTLEVQPGEEVTLLCSNISKKPTHTFWSRLDDKRTVSCIASMYRSDSEASFCDGFKKGFEMSSDVSTVFLKIKRVDLSDSGLYFCGFYIIKNIIINNTIHLNVQDNSESKEGVDFETEKMPDGETNLMSVILAGLTVFLTVVIIVLAVKIRKLQKAVTAEPQPERNKNLGSEDLNYAALSFHPKPKRNLKTASERELEPNVVYAATR